MPQLLMIIIANACTYWCSSSRLQFAYMRIMADNKPLLFPADKLTWDEVAHHNSKHDCWTVINGVV